MEKEKNRWQGKERSYRNDLETAEELVPSPKASAENNRYIGITAFVIALFAIFMFPFVLGTISIILGFISGKDGSAWGWWAVGIGSLALIMRFLAFPVLAIF